MKYILVMLFALFTHLVCANTKIDLVKVDKSARKMYLIKEGEIVKSFKIALGANPQGYKQQEGDEKTPEGTYVLDYKNEKSSFYRSMHISYPNAVDIENAKKAGVNPGGQIMVHGQKNGFSGLSFLSQNFDWTNGCIAITNAEMDEFMSLVDVNTKISIEW